MSLHGSTLGFSYLEPIRHIPFLADLDGPEAATFGPAIARASTVLREATGARLVYAYVFGGGIPHLHVHLAPTEPEGVLNTTLIEGRIAERKLPSGATEITSLDHPEIPAERVEEVIDRVRAAMRAPAAMTRWVCLDVGETLIDETRIWSLWADVFEIPRLTFMAALGAAISRGGEHADVFAIFGIGRDAWMARLSEVERRYGWLPGGRSLSRCTARAAGAGRGWLPRGRARQSAGCAYRRAARTRHRC